MDRATVICALRSGGPYGPDHVHRLERMCLRHMPAPHRFVCLTDVPERLACETLRMRYAWPGKWCKIELFDPALPLDGRLLYLDLDVVVQGSLAPFVETPFFCLASCGAQKPHPRRVALYNSSVMVWEHGSERRIFEWFRWDRVPVRYVGDQDWIGAVNPDAATFAPELIEKYRPGTLPGAPVVLCTNPKPHEILDDPFIRRHWLAGEEPAEAAHG